MISGCRVVYDDQDSASAGEAIVRALDGRISEQDARRAARAAFNSVGMERKRPAQFPASEGEGGRNADPS